MVCLGLEPGMVGADKSTELWRHPKSKSFVLANIFISVKVANSHVLGLTQNLFAPRSSNLSEYEFLNSKVVQLNQPTMSF